MTLDPLGPLRQTLYVSTLADLENAKVVQRGLFAMVEDHGFVSYVAVPDTVTSFTGTVTGIDVNWVPLSEILKITPTTRLISGSAPILINGGSSAHLSSDITISLDSAPFVNMLTGTGTTNRVAKFSGTHTIGDSSVVDDGTTVDLTTGIVTMHDVSLSGSPASGVELLQAYAGQLVARLQLEHLDYAVTPVNISASATKPPKIGQQTSQYTLTGPGTSTFTISPAIAGVLMQANRSMYGLLLCTQRLEAIATSGWAGLYLIEANTNSSANIISTAVTIALIGTCGGGTSPTITVVGTGSSSFTLSIANTLGGTLTGMWHLIYGHCGS